MNSKLTPIVSRELIYLSMVVILIAIFIGAMRGASPIYLAVGFIGEIILVSTIHLSSILQRVADRLAPPDIVGP